MRRLAPLLALLVLPLAACGDDGPDGTDETTLTVYAAASLTSTFEETADRFEAGHDGVTVKLSFGGSSDLAAQIQEGAPADVFASADTANMDKLTADGLVDGVSEFATNTLEIATPPDNPAGVSSFQDLGKAGLRLVVCAPEVPCGAATQTMAGQLGVTLAPVSEEQSVTDVLGKVTSGEADAGVVYVTDVTSAGDAVHGVAFPESDQVVNTYPIATVEGGEHAALAQEFADLVTGAAGQQILQDAGFGPP
ncbi:molybdate ABC transporter substrate-binding protein [Nocardioides sp. MAH-18]|uniref:Molybdate ABC transporter substrate-binding protein n=1 Tax=Nocardioides agri TaxID=2682843 RepID=A0A6L6XTG8_9ACTN|nr:MULTISPECIES: molybdate ABC transporter substrate-binding protein [unclassified Nocardioides]MBA2954082.1 molybdate ABC transporter substrate-binding protein [Nocardioides sp. CGMCC 1.13656]MVQ48945.1 molybdate ABC transporter substrate-binding protein [Nocardioides sp. MAH-18]